MNIFAAKLNRFGLSITQGRKIIPHETTLSVWIVRDLSIEYLVITKTFGGVDFEHVAPYPVSYPSLIMKVTIFVRGVLGFPSIRIWWKWSLKTPLWKKNY